ncbi:uncharacterized protein TNCV_2835271 [Trichonephila clavipes]|uniref:Uncharacterized protein n=1 Tax=Trichonephila clavipes TaxID=2585209 RepID=A0A8X6VBL2_TRICX|nr:uncharacterized protein TNCV_2835271 [Trichonephila clavipes]
MSNAIHPLRQIPSDEKIIVLICGTLLLFFSLLHPSECNKLFIRALENPARIFGSSPISRTMYYSAVAEDKIITLTSLVKMWMSKQMVQCVLCLTELKPFTGVQWRVRTEWNIVTGLPNRLIRTPSQMNQ